MLALLDRNLNQTSFAELIADAGRRARLRARRLPARGRRCAARRDAAAAVIASVWVVGCLYYLDLFGRLNAWLGGGFPMVRTLPIALAALALAEPLGARGCRAASRRSTPC